MWVSLCVGGLFVGGIECGWNRARVRMCVGGIDCVWVGLRVGAIVSDL